MSPQGRSPREIRHAFLTTSKPPAYHPINEKTVVAHDRNARGVRLYPGNDSCWRNQTRLGHWLRRVLTTFAVSSHALDRRTGCVGASPHSGAKTRATRPIYTSRHFENGR